MLQVGFIELVQSSWASPVILLPNSNGSWNLCIEYRVLNIFTVKDVYLNPWMNDYIYSRGSFTVFTAPSAYWGYWRIPIPTEDRDKTACVCHQRLYRSKLKTLRLMNAPATIQCATDILLTRFKWTTRLVYFKDIVVCSNKLDNRITHVKNVMCVLWDPEIKLKLKNCELYTDSVRYLGYIICSGQLLIDNFKVKSLKNGKQPTTETELRWFSECIMSIVGSYRASWTWRQLWMLFWRMNSRLNFETFQQPESVCLHSFHQWPYVSANIGTAKSWFILWSGCWCQW